MDLPLATAAAARVEWADTASSTNDELVRRAVGDQAGQWPDFSVFVTDTQTAGRGRLGRGWTAPPGSSLAASLLLRPSFPLVHFGWLPLLAGAAMVQAIRALGPGGAAATVKWPNDVRFEDRKICGILSELLPDAAGVVVGAGVNLSIGPDDLPVPTATSLVIEGLTADIDLLLGGYLRAFSVLYSALGAAGGDAQSSGLHETVSALCQTLGERVRAELPSGEAVEGRAVAIDIDGRLQIQRAGSAHPLTVAAGDVTHLRY